jgi:hypothetical protein
MRIGETSFGLDIPLPRASRYARRGVPGVEIRAAGPNCIFHRVVGVVDSGASLTLLTTTTARLLRLDAEKNYSERIEAAGGAIDYVRSWVQFRFVLSGKPPVSIFLNAGISPQLDDNLFGSDFLKYFFILIGRQTVHFLADVETLEARTS